jgi:maltooligosyltrehalose trehalohydrolase
MDAFWCDDFHHASHVALTGQKEAYYSDYTGTPQEFIDLFKYSALYQGQYYSWQKNNRGTPLERTPAESCVFFLQNHDQVANSLSGERVHRRTSPGLYRALSAILLLAPQTPLIFMGQETGDEAPFVFFGDYDRGLAPLVRDGRHDFLSQFPSYKTHRGRLPDPSDRSLWNAVKLKHAENPFITRLYHDLLRIRKEDVLIRKQDRFRIDGAVLSAHAFVIRFNGDGQGRLLVVNLDHDFAYAPLSTPLVAPGLGSQWKSLFSTEHPFYGGQGCFLRQEDEGWTIPARSATLLTNASGDI